MKMNYWFYSYLEKYITDYEVKIEGDYARSIKVPEEDCKRMENLFSIMIQPYFAINTYKQRFK